MIRELITELQSFGLRLQGNLSKRKGGAGPAEGGTLLVGRIPVSVPVSSQFVSQSPYILKEEEGQFFILKGKEVVCPVDLIAKPKFYDHSTDDGIPYPQLGLLHGKDCLATTVIQTCIFWHSKERCRFCGIELSHRNGQTIKIKSPDQLSEVACKAKELDSIEHIVLTTGTAQPPGKEISYLVPCAGTIKKTTGLPIHAQFCPPSDPQELHKLKEAGVDTAGIHVESFDPEVLSRIAPAKALIGFERYKKVWKTAVEIFGPNQVSSFLIVGLGEKEDSIIEGSEFLADLGVYPFVVPLRPIPGSLMEDVLPPDPERMKKIYEAVAFTLKRKGLSANHSLAGCVRCGACSALPAYEQGLDHLICHPVRTDSEEMKAFELRKEVFVDEQKLFLTSDRDENDSRSVHLVVELDHRIVGAVRVFPTDIEGHWVGGRLSVKREFRNTGAGELLVREAMQFVKERGCTKFTAHIQLANVPFFSRIGWEKVGPVKDYYGKPHQMMEANLEYV